jgi:hypothetical protein
MQLRAQVLLNRGVRDLMACYRVRACSLNVRRQPLKSITTSVFNCLVDSFSSPQMETVLSEDVLKLLERMLCFHPKRLTIEQVGYYQSNFTKRLLLCFPLPNFLLTFVAPSVTALRIRLTHTR